MVSEQPPKWFWPPGSKWSRGYGGAVFQPLFFFTRHAWHIHTHTHKHSDSEMVIARARRRGRRLAWKIATRTYSIFFLAMFWLQISDTAIGSQYSQEAGRLLWFFFSSLSLTFTFALLVNVNPCSSYRGDRCIMRLGLSMEGMLAWHLNGG